MKKPAAESRPAASATAEATPSSKFTFNKQQLRKWGPLIGLGALVVIGLAVLAIRSNSPVRPSSFAREALPLLQQESVQKELNLSFDQTARVTALLQQRQDLRASMQDVPREDRDRKLAQDSQAAEKEIRDMLDADQLLRLKQICFQQRGTRVWGEDEVIKTLRLTHDQRVELATIRDGYSQKLREIQRGDNKQDVQKKSDALRASTNERLLAVLTPEQLGKWNELAGPPFTGEIKRPDRRPDGSNVGGGGGRRGNRDRPPR